MKNFNDETDLTAFAHNRLNIQKRTIAWQYFSLLVYAVFLTAFLVLGIWAFWHGDMPLLLVFLSTIAIGIVWLIKNTRQNIHHARIFKHFYSSRLVEWDK